jgi:hypothetical protein
MSLFLVPPIEREQGVTTAGRLRAPKNGRGFFTRKPCPNFKSESKAAPARHARDH